MTESTAGIAQTESGKGPESSGSSSFTSVKAGKGWNFLPLAPGIFGVFLAYSLYPLLDGRYVLMGIVFLFAGIVALIPRSAIYSGAGLGLLAAALLLNGAMDRTPPSVVRATVIRKESIIGNARSGSYYHLVVSSLRPGRGEEQLEVDLGTYRRATSGKTVIVELHKGFYGIPWLGSITPE